MTEPCPHAGGGILICDRCVQRLVEPPKSKKDVAPADGGATPTGAKRKHYKAWIATLADGKKYTFERVGRGAAQRALLKLLKLDKVPAGTQWEPKE